MLGLEVLQSHLPVGNVCNRHHKIETRSGAAYAASINAQSRAPFRRAVQHVLKVLRNRDDHATVMMLQEMDALLKCLPQYPAQNSLRGLPPKERARALLYHIKRQEVTCPLWLYHLLCESRTVGHDGFRCRWAIAQRTVGPNLIVGLPPALHEHLYLPECIKQFPIQQFIT